MGGYLFLSEQVVLLITYSLFPTEDVRTHKVAKITSLENITLKLQLSIMFQTVGAEKTQKPLLYKDICPTQEKDKT